MSEHLRGIAARYAAALKASETLTVARGDARPSLIDIWLWKLEQAGEALVEHWKKKQRPDSTVRYDHFYIYAHRYCLNSKGDVRDAPDSALFEMMGLDPSQELGWFQFITREFGWHSMVAANWGHPVLKIPDGVQYDAVPEEARRVQAVAFAREVLAERGIDPIASARDALEKLKAERRERLGRDVTEAAFSRWVERRLPWFHYLLANCDGPTPSHLLTPPAEPQYVGDHRVKFFAEIREAAARRRRVWDAPHPADCIERDRERQREEGLAAEREHIRKQLNEQPYSRWVAEMGAVSDDRLWAGFMEYYADGRLSRDKWDTGGHMDLVKLHVFFLANPKALDLLRLPENRAAALAVKKYLSWVYLPD